MSDVGFPSVCHSRNQRAASVYKCLLGLPLLHHSICPWALVTRGLSWAPVTRGLLWTPVIPDVHGQLLHGALAGYHLAVT